MMITSEIKFYKRQFTDLLSEASEDSIEIKAQSVAQIIRLSTELQYSYNARYESETTLLRCLLIPTLQEALEATDPTKIVDSVIWNSKHYSILERQHISNTQVNILVGASR